MKKLLLFICLLPLFVKAQVNLTIKGTGANPPSTYNGAVLRDSALVPLKDAAGFPNGAFLIWDSSLKKARSGGLPSATYSFTSPLLLTAPNVVSIPPADNLTNGYLVSTDWVAFNAKQSPITVGTISNGGNANGMSLSAGTLRLFKVNATNGGVLSTGTDTIAGAKRFTGAITGTNGITASNGVLISTSSNSSSVSSVYNTGTGHAVSIVGRTNNTSGYALTWYATAGGGSGMWSTGVKAGTSKFSITNQTVGHGTPGTGTTSLEIDTTNNVFIPNLSLTNLASGTAGTDSILVKNSSNVTRKISPTYYAPIASPAFTGTTTRIADDAAAFSGYNTANNSQTGKLSFLVSSNAVRLTNTNSGTVELETGGAAKLIASTTDVRLPLLTTNGVVLTSGGTGALSSSATLPIANGGTGSATQNFVDLSTTQTVAGAKTFSSPVSANGLIIPNGSAFLGAGSFRFAGNQLNAYSGTAGFTVVKSDNSQANFTVSDVGIITANQLGTGAVQATAGVLSVVSDSKAKDLHGKYKSSALSAIGSLAVPQYWNYNAKSQLGENAYKVKQFGLLADSVHVKLGEEFAPTQGTYKDGKFIPTLIDGKETYGLSDRALLSLAIQAIQELKAEVDTLKNKK